MKAEKLAVIEDQDVVGVKRDNALDRGHLENTAIDFDKQRVKTWKNSIICLFYYIEQIVFMLLDTSKYICK